MDHLREAAKPRKAVAKSNEVDQIGGTMKSPDLPSKRAVLTALVEKLNEELNTLAASAKAAHEAATHEESKAEDQYDTRGLESSYLAAAQIHRAEELHRQIQFLSASPEDAHQLVTLMDSENETAPPTHYLLTKFGGGTKVSAQGKSVLVITPESPIGSELTEKKKGDFIEIASRGKSREYEIIDLH